MTNDLRELDVQINASGGPTRRQRRRMDAQMRRWRKKNAKYPGKSHSHKPDCECSGCTILRQMK